VSNPGKVQTALLDIDFTRAPINLSMSLTFMNLYSIFDLDRTPAHNPGLHLIGCSMRLPAAR
jgi:hypothetical protein